MVLEIGGPSVRTKGLCPRSGSFAPEAACFKGRYSVTRPSIRSTATSRNRCAAVRADLRAAINLLRDSVETDRMPSGLALEPQALAMHEAAIVECERLLAAARKATA